MNKKVLKRRMKFIGAPIIKYVTKDNYRRAIQYAKFYDNLKIKKNTILYESRDGKSLTDSPYAIFKYMIERPEYKDYIHIWSVNRFDTLSPVISKYKNHPNVKFILRNSKEYLKCLASCEYLINNSTFQSYYTSKKGQIYINTWHGTPLKSMGYDIPGNPAQSQNVVRNFLSADYLLSPNQHTTQMYLKSYKLNGLYQGKIIEEGYPRIDLTIKTNPQTVKDFLISQGINIDLNKENILYAPTWKGKNVSKANNDVLQIISDMDKVEESVGDKYNVLVKVHPFLYKEAVKYPELKNRLVPDYTDTNELLSAVDLLITDYSSIFFDYLVTNKPILFYTWDLDIYGEERGQYIKKEDLPGPLLFKIDDLIKTINDIDSVNRKYQLNYKKMRERFTNYEDGKVTERITQYIFGKQPAALNMIHAVPEKKEKILIYPGGMKNNGITSSFLNLMNNIDFDKYDVSCFTSAPRSKEVLNNINKMNKNVRLIFKPGVPLYRIFEMYRDKFIHNRGIQGKLGKKIFPEHAYIREHTRLFGQSRFDYIIDFSGYSYYWAKYLVVANAKKKICFMHNDLLSDSEREINGRHPHRINLRGLFTLYHRFDKLVSVSKGTMELNRKNLIQYADYNKFNFVLNSINPEKILFTEEETPVNQKTIRKFKARALLTNIKEYPLWSILPTASGSSQFLLDKNFEQAEILITDKAIVDNVLYYRFSYENREIGWINEKAVTLLSDSMISVKDVDEIALVMKPRAHSIWTKPYKLPGTKKVSKSYDYKNLVVSVDKEAVTQHSTFYRISVNNCHIGWIDKRALVFFSRCSLKPDTGLFNKYEILFARKLIKLRNHQKKAFLNHLEGRTLREIDIKKPKYYKVANVENEAIWNKPYPNYNAKQIDDLEKYKNSFVLVKKIAKTRVGIYALIYLQSKKIGWIRTTALASLNDPTIIEEKQVLKTASVLTDKKVNIWTKPYGLEGAEKVLISDNEELKESVYTLDKEVTTQKGTYAHVLKGEKTLGWININNLHVDHTYGYEVGGQYIPEPSSENYNFVNMGRLSPEKAQDNLIKAFADFHKDNPKSKLYILGQGPLKSTLQELIAELNIEDSVFLMGQLDNPFPFMKKCDCFVLSSHYEGQPMVLLEAMTLGMNILATDIIANRTVLENGRYGLLVEDSISGLVTGLNAMAHNEHPTFDKFQYLEYNKAAMGTFYRCLHD